MKQKSKILIIMFLCSLYIAYLKGQQTIPSSGGNATGSGGSISNTVGQLTTSTLSGTTGSVAQGVQQPFEISVVTGIEEEIGIILEFSVYPNPATDFIKLKIENYEVQNLRYQLYNISGSLLQVNKIHGNETSIVNEQSCS